MKKQRYLKKPLIYALFGSIWILLSDFLLSTFAEAYEWFYIWQNLKGILYVLATAVLFSFYLKRSAEYEKIKYQKDNLTTLINSTSDFVVYMDPEGKWLMTNEQTKQYFQICEYKGMRAHEILSHLPHIHRLITPCREVFDKAWDTKLPQAIEGRVKISDNESIILSANFVPLFFPNGRKRGIFIIGRDVTEKRNAEEALVKDEKLSVVSHLAAGVAHEIGNPLTTLKGFVQLLEKEKNDKVLQPYYSIMIEEIEQIHAIINELLLVSTEQKTALENESIIVILWNAFRLVENEAKMKNITLELLGDENPQLMILCEKNHLKHAFLNIFKNAIEASEEGQKVKIEVSRLNENYIQVKVTDHGKGMDSERLKLVGEPFYTVKEKGTGLGLTVTYRIINEHNGKISIKSEVGNGTVVDVILPAAVS
ncbi:PAS domain-containing protein [bacterium LRH843]|nr:PAS domain-containing protein [bacterium LRH843]